MVGGVTGLATVAWISIGTQLSMAKGLIINPEKPVSVEGCDHQWVGQHFVNATSRHVVANEYSPFVLYRLSYQYYTLVGCATVLIVGLIVSYLTGGNGDRKLDKSLFTPVIHRFLGQEHNVNKELKNEKNTIYCIDKKDIVLNKVN